MRNDYILLDDDLEIMVFPHKPSNPQWITYEELDRMERVLSPRITSMLHTYNEMASWLQTHKNELRKEIGE
jgi:hypothetical protein